MESRLDASEEGWSVEEGDVYVDMFEEELDKVVQEVWRREFVWFFITYGRFLPLRLESMVAH